MVAVLTVTKENPNEFTLDMNRTAPFVKQPRNVCHKMFALTSFMKYLFSSEGCLKLSPMDDTSDNFPIFISNAKP